MNAPVPRCKNCLREISETCMESIMKRTGEARCPYCGQKHILTGLKERN